MSQTALVELSNQLADVIAATAQSVVQVRGRKQPASGVVHSNDVVVTTTRAVGSEENITVRTPDGRDLPAEFAGWDPATHLVALRVKGLDLPAMNLADQPRVGHLAVAVGRSWSNSLTASSGMVSVIGGPLPTGRGRVIEEIIRTSASMHRGFAGGAFVSTGGTLLGITTAVEIRGLGVVIPAGIAWKTVEGLLTHGRAKRRYIGVAGQAVRLAAGQRTDGGSDTAVLVVQVVENSPAERAGLLVGDVLVALNDQPVDSPDRLVEILAGTTTGTTTLRILRGGSAIDVPVEIGEK